MSTLDVLAQHQGDWSGTNKLWFEDPDKAEESPGTLCVAGNQIQVTWAFRGAAQQGVLTVAQIEDSVSVSWTDSWHAGEGMDFTGEAFADAIDVFGTYPAGDGPDWGWRIVLDLEDPDRLLLRMYNITPDGDEMIAVELDGVR